MGSRDAEARGIGPPDDHPSGTPEISSAQLFRGATEIVIRHGGDSYRLRITRQNKLILNK